MPDQIKPAIELLQDLDLNVTKQIDPQNLNFLIDHLERSRISENLTPILQPKNRSTDRRSFENILKLRRGNVVSRETDLPEYEVEKISAEFLQVGVNKTFDLGQIFTIPEKILGPFPTIDGTQIYYNFYKYINDLKIIFPNESQAAFIIPVKIQRLIPQNFTLNTLTLSKGNVWIRADILDPAAPKEKYIGLKITSGTIKLGGTFPMGNNSVQIPKNSLLEIDLVLDNTYTAENLTTIGSDGKNSVFKPSEKIKLKSARGRLNVAQTDAFYGKTLTFESDLQLKENFFFWDNENNYMCLPLQSRESAFLCRGSQSELYDLRGRARIARSQWMLPSRVLAQNQSVEVKFNGALSLFLGSGLSTIWDGLRGQDSNVKVNECQILFLNGLFHLETKTADFNNLHDHLTLWQKSVENNAKMELAILFKDYGIFQITSQSDSGDAVNCFADTEFLIDKPILARNIPVHPRSKKSIYAKVLTKDSRSLLIIDNDLLTEDNETDPTNFYYAAPKVKKYQFALENAYFTTGKEKNLYLNAKYDQFNHLYEGNLMLTFYILNLLPTLPHPYTTNSLPNIDIRDDASGNLQAITSWTTTQEETLAEVTFKMKHTFSDVEKVARSFTDKEALMVRNNGTHIQNSFLLFDVSTQSDHWGIALTFQNEAVMRKLYNDDVNITSENVVTINKNYLQAPMGFLSALTLPQVSWEPVNNITPPTTPVDPETGILEQINNPIPTIFSQFDNKLIKIHPKDYMKNFQFNLKSAQNAGNKKFDSKILFTLPNGKYSLASLNPYTNETMYNENHLDFIMPDFEVQNRKLRGGIQFRIAAYKDPNPDAPPRMTGRTHQLKTIVNAPGISILGETVTNIFNNVFDPSNSDIAVGVPITHIDFSGYGASTFSNWKNPLVKFASISQAKFDILKGRTAHELVQAVSVIYPWGISTTRTVTFLRNNNAVIFREDSGWIAQSEGLFDFSFSWATGSTTNNYKNPFDIYPGLVQGLFDVKNIREDYSDVIKFNYNTEIGDYYLDKATNTILQNVIKLVQVEFVAVYFDANVKLDALDKEITGKRFKGYLQVKPEGIPIPSRVLRDVLSKSQNAISGNIDILLPVERTLQKFKANAVEISSSYENDNEGKITFVASVKGAVVLPPGGSWSVVEVDKTSGIVQNMKTGTSTGLVKDGLRPKINGHPFTLNSTKTLLAFPDGLKNSVAKFSKTYGLLQNTDTQKLLLGSLEFNKGQNDQFSSDPALLADCFRLMNSKGPFPNLKDAIQIDNVVKTVMKVGEDALSKTFQVEVPDNLPFDIIGKDGDDFHIYLKYSSIKKDGTNDKKSIIDYVTDSGSPEDKWSNLMQNMTIGVDLLVFKPIMYITGNFDNKKTGSPGLNSGTGPQLKLDSTLQKIYDLLEFLNNLDPTQPSEAVKKGLKIAMSNSADSWEYKFKAEKEIPLVKFPFDPINYNSPTTPLKMDAFFKMGVYFNQPIKIPNTIDQIKPSVGAFLELGAELRVMCVSVAAATIYAVGTAEVGLAADMNTPPSLYFKFGFGVQLAVGLPVIGSVAVTYMVGIDMKINSTELVVGAFIYFRGRVEIFGGIVTITISIEAAGKIQNKIGNGPSNCIAVCTFALDISIAFIIDISFTETWEETRQIS